MKYIIGYNSYHNQDIYAPVKVEEKKDCWDEVEKEIDNKTITNWRLQWNCRRR